MLALLLVAASVGLSNFAAAIAIGVTGVDAGTRLRVGLIFGAFESGMPVLGLLLGEQAADVAQSIEDKGGRTVVIHADHADPPAAARAVEQTWTS